MSGISSKKNSINGELVASSCRKGEGSRAEDVDAVNRKLDAGI
jgi:hypothetical protein